MDNFGSVQAAMLSFFKTGTNGEQWGVYHSAVRNTGAMNSALFIIIQGFIHVSLLNILTAIFVEQVYLVVQPDKDLEASEKQMKMRREAEELRSVIHDMDR